MVKMTTLTMGGVTHEIVDEAARADIDILKTDVELLQNKDKELLERINDVSDTLLNGTANIITKKVEGNVLGVNDVSPVKHEIKVKVICPDGINPINVGVVRCGKNLLTNVATNESYNGIVITVNEDKSLTVNGTATDQIFYAPYKVTFKAGVEYILSGCPDNGSDSTYFMYINQLGGVRDYGKGTSILLEEDFTSEVGFCIRSGATINNLTFKPMVRLATIQDEHFEKFVGNSYTPTNDGVINGVTSLSPSMSILTDTEGVTVECEYNVDTKTYIDQKFAELQALIQ